MHSCGQGAGWPHQIHHRSPKNQVIGFPVDVSVKVVVNPGSALTGAAVNDAFTKTGGVLTADQGDDEYHSHRKSFTILLRLAV